MGSAIKYFINKSTIKLDMQDIADIINKVGFPIFIAVYLLIRMDPMIRDIRDEMRKHNGHKS